MKTIISILFIACFINTTHAQFLERLADKATKAAERTVERKVEQKSQKETEKAFDSTFNKKRRSKKNKNKKRVVTSSNKTPNATYAFTHKYVMQMESGKYNTTMTYYLAKNENYFGSAVESVNTMINVMDLDKQTLFMYSEAGGTKMLMATSLDISEFIEDNDATSNTRVKKSGKTKTILGYPCHEYVVTSDDMTGSVWVTQSANISFPNNFYNINNKKQKNNQQWMNDVDGLVLEMQMTDTSKMKPETMTMHCVALEKESFKIKSDEYKKFM